MRCYYETLNVSQDAADDDLKKAYRKLALKWHPDKNPDNVEEAKREFILVQQAYEVLIDVQERAWYDKHREAILKGAGSGYKDDSIDIFTYFSTSCFRGYEDDDNGFYSVYREVFNNLAAEESEYLSDNDDSPPDFGTSQSSFDDVKEFYGYWSSFSTKKSYCWLNTYDISEAENRRILRLMEQENKKVRDKAKKARNEEIRELVAFVRKRDKRVQAYAEYLRQKTEENIKKTEENRRKMINKHRENIKTYKESDWCKFSNLENELKEIEVNMASEYNDHSDDDSDDDLYCVACSKYFKTEKAFANHEKSKKHKENVVVLKSTMVEEEKLVSNENDVDAEQINENVENSLDDESPVEEVVEPKSSKSSKSKKKWKNLQQRIVSDEEIDLCQLGVSKKQKKKLQRQKILEENDNDSSESETEAPEEEISTFTASSRNKSKKNKKPNPNECKDSECKDRETSPVMDKLSKKQEKKLQQKLLKEISRDSSESATVDPEEEIPSFAVHSQSKTKKSKKSNQIECKDNNTNPVSNNLSKKQKKKLERETEEKIDEEPSENLQSSKKKSKKLKNSDMKANGSVGKTTVVAQNTKSTSERVQNLDFNHECATCNESFDSKNKLFQHLKSSGHSILLPSKSGKSTLKTKKK